MVAEEESTAVAEESLKRERWLSFHIKLCQTYFTAGDGERPKKIEGAQV